MLRNKNILKGKKEFKNFFDFIFKNEKKRYTVEDTIPYIDILDDGICVIENNSFSKAIEFFDINYELSCIEDKYKIFNQFSSILNSFSCDVSFQFLYINQKNRLNKLRESIEIKDREDGHDYLRKEFRDILQDNISIGINDIRKTRYLIFSVKSDNLINAQNKLKSIELDILNRFRVMEVKAKSVRGLELYEIIHNLLNPDKDFNITTKNKITKSDVACHNFHFIKNYVRFGNYIGSIGYIQILANDLSDKVLSELLGTNNNINISFCINPIEQQTAIKIIKRKNTDIDKMKIEEQKKAIRAGYDIDIIPSDINTYGEEVKNILENIQKKDEKLFTVSILIMNYAESIKEVDNSIYQIKSILNNYNCELKNLSYRQEQGLISMLPLSINNTEISRSITTSSLAVFMPFKTTDLIINSKDSFYYGVNPLNNNIIMADKKLLKNPNSLILGTPGSGKSFSAKREIINSFLVTNDDIIIMDPEGEYGELVKEFGGEVIKISSKNTNYLNPLDINTDSKEDLKDKSNFIITMIEVIVGELTAEEKSIIDRCIPIIYSNYFKNQIKENIPTLQDLYNNLKKQDEVAKKIATKIEIYVTGSLNIFNNQSNIDINNRLICFDIKELASQMKKIGMLVIQNQIWNKVSKNRGNKSTRYYIDEFHLLLKEQDIASYSVEIWKRFRKWGGIPVGITQNVKDLLISKEIENILDNTDFILLLNQASGDREILSKKLKISEYQQKYITNTEAGEGLLFFGSTIIPFVDKFPRNTILYKKMTTKPEEMVD